MGHFVHELRIPLSVSHDHRAVVYSVVCARRPPVPCVLDRKIHVDLSRGSGTTVRVPDPVGGQLLCVALFSRWTDQLSWDWLVDRNRIPHRRSGTIHDEISILSSLIGFGAGLLRRHMKPVRHRHSDSLYRACARFSYGFELCGLI